MGSRSYDVLNPSSGRIELTGGLECTPNACFAMVFSSCLTLKSYEQTRGQQATPSSIFPLLRAGDRVILSYDRIDGSIEQNLVSRRHTCVILF